MYMTCKEFQRNEALAALGHAKGVQRAGSLEEVLAVSAAAWLVSSSPRDRHILS